MTPQEKAQQLVDKFVRRLNYEFGDMVLDAQDPGVKECALIAVDEVISNIEPSVSMDIIEARIKYWEQVKEEIQKV